MRQLWVAPGWGPVMGTLKLWGEAWNFQSCLPWSWEGTELKMGSGSAVPTQEASTGPTKCGVQGASRAVTRGGFGRVAPPEGMAGALPSRSLRANAPLPPSYCWQWVQHFMGAAVLLETWLARWSPRVSPAFVLSTNRDTEHRLGPVLRGCGGVHLPDPFPSLQFPGLCPSRCNEPAGLLQRRNGNRNRGVKSPTSGSPRGAGRDQPSLRHSDGKPQNVPLLSPDKCSGREIRYKPLLFRSALRLIPGTKSICSLNMTNRIKECLKIFINIFYHWEWCL